VLGSLPDGVDVACLLITGTAGAGKSAVAKEIGELLRGNATGYAVIDLDAIAKCETDPPVPGRFESALLLANLEAIWPNYRRYGVRFFVLARAVVDRSELDDLRACIPRSHWTVCRLTAPEPLVAQRLRMREPGIAQDFLLRVSPALAAEMAAEAIEDFLVTNADRPLTNVAGDVLDEWRQRLPRERAQASRRTAATTRSRSPSEVDASEPTTSNADSR
jgi:predicted kinase